MELTDILQQIDSLKKEGENLQTVKPELDRIFWEKFSMEFNYNSNHIEGNTLTYGQTKLLLLFDRITGDNKGRDVEEMKAHNVALKMITELSSDPESRLSEKLIREINELILVRPFYNDAITQDGQPTKRLITPGKYKSHPNSVLLPDGNMFYYASPEETPALMGDLMEWYYQNKEEIHPVKLAALIHYKLIRIHPFDDSNGRTTRLIMNFILMQNGYAPIVIESKKKEFYLAALNKADVGDINAFVDYIATLSIRWQEIYLKAMKGEKIEEEGDFEKEVSILKKNIENSKDSLNRPFDDDVMSEICNTVYLPIIYKTIDKLSLLDSLFFSKTMKLELGKSDFGTVINNEGIEKKLKEILSNHLKMFDNLVFSYTHNILKREKGVDFNYETGLMVRFENFFYRISFGSKDESKYIKKYYHQKLTEAEIEKIVSYLANNELNAIKKITEN